MRDDSDRLVASPHYDWSPIIGRTSLTWPRGARVAVVFVLTLERMEWYPPAGTLIPPTLRRFHDGVYPRVPDLQNTTQYEYGNRVGFFRVMDVLARHHIPVTIAADARVLDDGAAIVEYAQERGAEFIGHGIAGNRFITDAMPLHDEIAGIEQAVESVRRATGTAPRGWHNPEYSASPRTLDALAAQRIDYVIDWPTDEQPHILTAAERRIVNLPPMVELDDALAYIEHAVSGPHLADISIRQLKRLLEDGAESGRLFLMNVHPWLTGQPFRIRHFARLVDFVAAQRDVWATTGEQVCDWFLAGADLEAER